MSHKFEDLPKPKDPKAATEAMRKLNKVGKWRSILVGRILGTKPADDPPTMGMRDLMDKMVILRVEVSTVTRLLIEKGLVTPDDWFRVMGEEAEALDKMYEAEWPGIHTTDQGVTITNPEGFETIMRKSPG